ncbi:ATP-dependent Lon protease [Photobacterium carnosum]|uniref:ATP-dependent Lon protease n=1 Tax=Photobacterium carnosum TaxID=2023717 RepID=UPI001E51405B|nr:ATP-dependent Lon protease [Photobacterium carnosum]MCD9514643.1 ATP-dependent Lon protease [Photobacterium carnosum]MCD9529291.1 ATP-dependent Lon protease [Photobacterium carnosum]MCF2153732.1 ATP-dependent Lon protease [Photobacterium carnosum]MCF2215396.1 ATP-dependent Lon protease [Photobacterium carnosum]
MVIAPLQSTTPVLATTINPLTDQVARDNRVREKIVPIVESREATAESALSAEEKQRNKSSWDPSDHPNYSQPQTKFFKGYQQHLTQIVQVLSLDNYVTPDQPLGYSMHIELPRELLQQLALISASERTKGVVSHHYAQSTLPNPPTQYLSVI